MAELKINDQGLWIPAQLLVGLPANVRVRPVKDGIIIESASQAAIRDRLRAMVSAIRAAAEENTPEDAEIAELIDEVRAQRAGHR